VQPDGTIDATKLPAASPVMGPDGEPLLDAQGNQVMMPTPSPTDGPEPGTAPGTLSTNTDPQTDEVRNAETVVVDNG
jgi:hypothetical protein